MQNGRSNQHHHYEFGPPTGQNNNNLYDSGQDGIRTNDDLCYDEAAMLRYNVLRLNYFYSKLLMSFEFSARMLLKYGTCENLDMQSQQGSYIRMSIMQVRSMNEA